MALRLYNSPMVLSVCSSETGLGGNWIPSLVTWLLTFGYISLALVLHGDAIFLSLLYSQPFYHPSIIESLFPGLEKPILSHHSNLPSSIHNFISLCPKAPPIKPLPQTQPTLHLSPRRSTHPHHARPLHRSLPLPPLLPRLNHHRIPLPTRLPRLHPPKTTLPAPPAPRRSLRFPLRQLRPLGRHRPRRHLLHHLVAGRLHLGRFRFLLLFLLLLLLLLR